MKEQVKTLCDAVRWQLYEAEYLDSETDHRKVRHLQFLVRSLQESLDYLDMLDNIK